MPTELMEMFYYVKFIAEGTDGSVHLMAKKDTGKKYAVKFVKTDSLTKHDMYTKNFPLESRILIDLVGAKGIVQLEYVFKEKNINLGELKDVTGYAYVMDTPPTEPYVDLYNYKAYFKEELRVIFSHIAQGLREMEKRNITHVDLHSSNVLVETSLKTTIIDFSRAQYKNTPYPYVEPMTNVPHTLPEIRKKGKKGINFFDYDQLTVWSMGLIIFEKYSKNTKQPAHLPDMKRYPSFPPMVKDLLSRIFVSEAAKRISFKDMLEHPFFNLKIEEDYSTTKGGDELR